MERISDTRKVKLQSCKQEFWILGSPRGLESDGPRAPEGSPAAFGVNCLDHLGVHWPFLTIGRSLGEVGETSQRLVPKCQAKCKSRRSWMGVKMMGL